MAGENKQILLTIDADDYIKTTWWSGFSTGVAALFGAILITAAVLESK